MNHASSNAVLVMNGHVIAVCSVHVAAGPTREAPTQVTIHAVNNNRCAPSTRPKISRGSSTMKNTAASTANVNVPTRWYRDTRRICCRTVPVGHTQNANVTDADTPVRASDSFGVSCHFQPSAKNPSSAEHPCNGMSTNMQGNRTQCSHAECVGIEISSVGNHTTRLKKNSGYRRQNRQPIRITDTCAAAWTSGRLMA